jgi:hypothetical protein
MVPDPALRKRTRATLQRAVDLILKSQNKEGGWRYKPDTTDADLSVTICQVMALRSARNAGLFIPKSTVDRCVDYVRGCYNGDGTFRYQKGRMGGFGPSIPLARMAAGVCALYSAGIYQSPEIELALKKLLEDYKPGHWRNLGELNHEQNFFYGQYYAAQAMWTAGGRYWTEWFPAIREDLLSRVQFAGQYCSWKEYQGTDCPHYGTAMACLILQIPNNYLPIFQK